MWGGGLVEIFNHVEMASNVKLSLKSVISASRISLPSDHFLPKKTLAFSMVFVLRTG